MPKVHNFLDRLTGSLSKPCNENPTVAMVESAYRHQLRWRYINCEVAPQQLAVAVRGARAMNWAGFNCSIPHKVAVIQHLDDLGESAAIMVAVNCVVNRGGKLIGENTDGEGFLESLRTLTDRAASASSSSAPAAQRGGDVEHRADAGGGRADAGRVATAARALQARGRDRV